MYVGTASRDLSAVVTSLLRILLGRAPEIIQSKTDNSSVVIAPTTNLLNKGLQRRHRRSGCVQSNIILLPLHPKAALLHESRKRERHGPQLVRAPQSPLIHYRLEITAVNV
mmetsp:Transcript_23269/g.50586  ORF Transcript_23269/g.50586 Transcript_23269/m.50586 type:complete len:111 (-) Transcript_23269:670-1002(-)